MSAPGCEIEIDNFKHVYKKYKRRDRVLDTSDVIDFSSSTSFDERNRRRPVRIFLADGKFIKIKSDMRNQGCGILKFFTCPWASWTEKSTCPENKSTCPGKTQNFVILESTVYLIHILGNKNVEQISLHEPPNIPQFPGMKPVSDWKAYQLKHCKGLIVIPNPFKPKYQRYWIQRCLLDFPVKPNRTNLDAHMERPSQIWHQCVNGACPDLDKGSLLMKLRWATLGFQYEWNTKEYFADRIQAFPDDLKHICAYIAATLGYSAYSSEAGIVNYYRMESTLMGHTDVSELDKAAPLISFSFGQSCIFLIGGPTKETEPIPLFLNSGDICLMTDSARLSFHAVPRILPGRSERLLQCFYGDDKCDIEISEPSGNSSTSSQKRSSTGANSEMDSKLDSEVDEDPYNAKPHHKPPAINIIKSDTLQEKEDIVRTPTVGGNKCTVDELEALMDSVIANTDWKPFHLYLAKSRVNVNVRQVLKAGLSLGMSP